MSAQLDIDFARGARDDGVRRAADHAEESVSGWGDLALLFLRRYATSHEYFSPEDVTEAADSWGLVKPPDRRAWGGVYLRAQNRGLILRSDKPYQRRFGHATKSFLWKSLIVSVTTA